MKLFLIALFSAVSSQVFAVLPVSREITLKNNCIERKATLENADYIQARIEHGEQLWQRTRKNLETARAGLRQHAELLEQRIADEGADHTVVCQGNKIVKQTENTLTDLSLTSL